MSEVQDGQFFAAVGHRAVHFVGRVSDFLFSDPTKLQRNL
jgi:hypothetical protein